MRPAVGIMAMSPCFLMYPPAAAVRFAFEFACVLIAVNLVLAWFCAVTPRRAVLVTLVLFAWKPFREELVLG